MSGARPPGSPRANSTRRAATSSGSTGWTRKPAGTGATTGILDSFRQLSTDADLNRGREVADAFLAASRAGDFDALMSLLDSDVAVRRDGTPLTAGGAKPAAEGAVRVATWFSKGAEGLQRAVIDGAPGIVWAPGGQIRGVLGLTITDRKIVEINLIADPDRIREFDTMLVEE